MTSWARWWRVLVALCLAASWFARAPAAFAECSWAGDWSSNWNQMRLTQDGIYVVGDYDYLNGTISGTVDGDTLRGVWTQSNGQGRFVFTISADCNSFEGTWGYGDADTGGGWNATRANAPTAPSNCSWSGTWNTDYDQMTLAQSGSQVTGSYEWDGGQLSGAISGNTLSGNWTQVHGAGTFTFTMSPDCNSFAGKLEAGGGTSGDWNGTRVGVAPTAQIPPTNTLVPPTNTPVPPTNTPLPPTSTVAPPSATRLPPTTTRIPPSPTWTPSPTRPPTQTTIALPPTTIAPPSSIALPTTPSPVTPTGDCNNDGKLSEVDALCALDMSVGARPSQANMDMDGDGNVTSRDAEIILQPAVEQ